MIEEFCYHINVITGCQIMALTCRLFNVYRNQQVPCKLDFQCPRLGL